MTGWAVLDALGVGIAVLLMAWTSLLYVPFRWRQVGLYLFVPKLAAGAFTPFIAAAGLLLVLVGGLRGSWWMAVPAGLAAVGACIVIVRLGLLRADLAAALGPDWAGRIPVERHARMVGRWWRGRLPIAPAPRLRQDVVFATVPGTGRDLLCDVWQPPAGVPVSGLAVVYLHGSAWYILDKDTGTRPLFRYLAAQGHVIVDVAYRLFPETDITGMVADAKRAVAWVKNHAADLDVQADRIVLAGGSAGGHLALLAAYAHDDPALTPAELAGSDPGVCGVVSLYGQADLAAVYDHTSQQKTCRPDDPRPDWDAPPPPWMTHLFGPDAGRLKLHMLVAGAGRLDWLVGGTPSEMPDRYARLSPVEHVHPGCPPTLLVHGEHDEMAPVAAMRQLHRRLEQAGVPVTAVYLPQTEHGFDVLATAWSPPARTAIHVLERFLAVLAATDQGSAAQPISGSRAERVALPQHARCDMKGEEHEMTRTRSAEGLAAPLGSVDMGRLVFTRGAAHLTIGVDGSMADLYRARFEGKVPDIRVDQGTVTVKYRPSLRPTRGEITLSGRVPWAINARLGTSDVVADLQDLELTDLEISGGASRLEVKLPHPKAAVRVRVGAGTSNVELIRPAGVPVRVRIGGGASKLAIDDFRVGAAGGKTDWRSPDYDLVEGRYDIQIGAGASKLTVRT